MSTIGNPAADELYVPITENLRLMTEIKPSLSNSSPRESQTLPITETSAFEFRWRERHV